jgi:hypothetical protein
VGPDNQATITGVTLCCTRLDADGVHTINNKKGQYDGVVASGGMTVILKLRDIGYLVYKITKDCGSQ